MSEHSTAAAIERRLRPSKIAVLTDALTTLARACRDQSRAGGQFGTCLLCGVPLSTMHERDCPVEAAVKVLEPAYARHADEAATMLGRDLLKAAVFMLDLIDWVYGTDNEGMDLPEEAEYRKHAAVIRELAVNMVHQSPSEPRSDDPEGPDRA